MRSLAAIATSLVLLAGGLTRADTPAHRPPASPTAEQGLVAHEWGTFTSFAPSHGQSLKFNIAVGEDLPDFVFSPARQAGDEQLHNLQFSGKFDYYAQQRMETPVIYFHSDRPLDVSVRVGFPSGLLTEFYPPVTECLPAPAKGGARSSVGGGALRWDRVHIEPAGSASGQALIGGVPQVTGGSHYGVARSAQSDPVRIVHDGATHAEKFLFYRGLGNFALPLTLTVEPDGLITLSLTGQSSSDREPKTATPGATVAFGVNVRGGAVRWCAGGLNDGLARLQLPATPGKAAELQAIMVASLAGAGLNTDEAQAMVDTWRSLWLGEDGTRVLYILPQSMIDPVLPLTISPTPAAIKRVFVARLEVLTPESERAIEIALANQDPRADIQLQSIPNPGVSPRFFHCAVRSVTLGTQDARAAANGRRLLGL